jgi:hypothetical protein
MLKIKFWKIEAAYGLIKDIKAFYIQFRKSFNLPIKKSYVGYTVFPSIPIPCFPLLVQLPKCIRRSGLFWELQARTAAD